MKSFRKINMMMILTLLCLFLSNRTYSLDKVAFLTAIDVEVMSESARKLSDRLPK